ncbi:MAG: 4Fe-4S binding protein [Candidatus Hydrothermarchaeales archaeon]
MNFELGVEDKNCSGCGNCVIVCPVNAFNSVEVSGGKGGVHSNLILDIGKGVAYVFDPELCNGCGACIKACAHDAVLLDSIKQAITSELRKTDELEILGEKGLVYKAIKENGPLTIPQIAEASEIPPRSVLKYVASLKGDGKIWEAGRADGEYLYTAERPAKGEVVEEEIEVFHVDLERYKEFKERIEKALESLSGVKVRSLTESGKLEKAKEAMEKKISEVESE